MSAIGAIRQRFAIGQQHSSSFEAQQGAAAKSSLGRNIGEGADEVDYGDLNSKDLDYDLQMLEDGLEYEAYQNMADSEDDRE